MEAVDSEGALEGIERNDPIIDNQTPILTTQQPPTLTSSDDEQPPDMAPPVSYVVSEMENLDLDPIGSDIGDLDDDSEDEGPIIMPSERAGVIRGMELIQVRIGVVFWGILGVGLNIWFG